MTCHTVTVYPECIFIFAKNPVFVLPWRNDGITDRNEVSWTVNGYSITQVTAPVSIIFPDNLFIKNLKDVVIQECFP
jgi:hypothetical protein